MNQLKKFAMVALFFVASAQAEVSLKNGNFFVGFKDLAYPGGFAPKIERVYNSKTPFKGTFGWGWGSEYEVYLTVSADGSVVVHEFGGGAENRFNPLAFNEKELNAAVEKIASVAAAVGAMGTKESFLAYKQKLKGDARFRNQEWEKFRAQGKIPARQLAEGTQLRSNRFSYQYLTKVKNGYTRVFDSGKIEQFSELGKLVKVSDRRGNFVEFEYATDGHIKLLKDNQNRKMVFSFNNRGLLESVSGESGKQAFYKYNAKDELVYSKDAEGNVYTYSYDSQDRHNMTEIGYSDKTKMVMTYWDRDKNENVRSVQDRDGSVTEYDYLRDKADKGHVTVSSKLKSKDGKRVIANSSYEYFLKNKANGEEWTYKLVTVQDGDRTETVYNECCGLPILIKKAGQETAFEYDPKGRVTKKTTPTELTELIYDPRVGKVAKVVRHSKTLKGKSRWSTFQYNEKGDLLFAKNSENKGVKLIYDTGGRIASMVDQDNRQIFFKYDENSKPIEIRDPKLGTIHVEYDASGEVKKVDSGAGRKVAMEVTSAFQNLLDIIRPAGVTLSF